MSAGESIDPSLDDVRISFRVFCPCQPHDRLHKRQRILGTMIDFLQEQMLGCLQILRRPPRGDVDLRREEETYIATVIEYRADQKLIPERPIITMILEDLDSDLLTIADCLAHFFDDCWIGVGALQETAIAADNVVTAIASHFEKSFVR
jgi:hypothetical protein